MESFNLKKYLENPGRKILTGAGIPVRIICTNRKSENCPIVALTKDRIDDIEYANYYTIDGKWNIDGNNLMDLFFAPEKKEGWINLYKNSINRTYLKTSVFETKEEAEKYRRANDGSIATIKIEWEE